MADRLFFNFKILDMSIAKQMLKELQQEAVATRKVLALVPLEKGKYAPHAKSMPMLNLARHIAEIYGWAKETIQQDELDFAVMDYTPKPIESTEDLLALFDKCLATSTSILNETTDEEMGKPWRMRNGETIYFTLPKTEVMRTWVLNHIVHHRAQLGVYLRMLDIALPSTYGPTADEA